MQVFFFSHFSVRRREELEGVFTGTNNIEVTSSQMHTIPRTYPLQTLFVLLLLSTQFGYLLPIASLRNALWNGLFMHEAGSSHTITSSLHFLLYVTLLNTNVTRHRNSLIIIRGKRYKISINLQGVCLNSFRNRTAKSLP